MRVSASALQNVYYGLQQREDVFVVAKLKQRRSLLLFVASSPLLRIFAI
jgi:hypothetical protein